MKETIGKRIRKIRESKDYSQQNVADALEITTSSYSKIERGETEASASKLVKIAEILEVPVGDFFVDIGQSQKISDPAQLYGFATKSDIEELVKMINAVTKDVAQLKTKLSKLDTAGVKKRK